MTATVAAAPTTAAEAAAQLHDLTSALHRSSVRRIAVAQAAAHAEWCYRQAKAEKLLTVEGRNAEQRDAAAMVAPVGQHVAGRAHSAADAAGLSDVPLTTVSDLRLLRDLTAALSEAGRDHVRACQAQVQAWMVVAGMARSEREVDARSGP